MAPNPLLRSRSHAKKTFGAATEVNDPRLQKIRIQNNGTGGHAATVAGYAGPGFHNWPSGHIPQDNGSESASSQPVPCQKGVRRRDRGQRPTATKNPNPKQRHWRPCRHCSRVRRPRFPHLAPRPHPSNAESETRWSIGYQGATPSRWDTMPRLGHGSWPDVCDWVLSFFFSFTKTPSTRRYIP
jgi:hypothetical protein